MIIDFDGNTVAVTGAVHGFGRATARIFADFGANVFATDLAEDGLAVTGLAGGIVGGKFCL